MIPTFNCCLSLFLLGRIGDSGMAFGKRLKDIVEENQEHN